MEIKKLRDASCRVALSAYLHDLGKFAERANLDVDGDRLDTHLALYARRNEAGGRTWYSHRHAAWTALVWDLLESNFPELVGDDVFPFAGWNQPGVDDSIVNAAGRHHKPDTFLQWIVATADRVASGFEREEFERYNSPDEDRSDRTEEGRNHFTARQLTLFEQINLAGPNEAHRAALRWRYPLRPLSVEALFPVRAEGYETADNGKAQQEYRRLWEQFTKQLVRIPASHRANWPLWLDHFDSAWGCFTQAIPAATAFNVRPEVSLYDHSRTTAALATALWRYHHDLGHDDHAVRAALADPHRPDWDEPKLLLVQGDFFGIQDFLFASGGDTQRKAARLLRGRSFYVSLLTECAALRILETLGLPPTSQVVNAAGKFLVVAPNTPDVREKLARLQFELDAWFLEHTYGQAGIGIAWLPAACNDFLRGGDGERAPFARLVDRLFDALNTAKARRLDLCGTTAPPAVFETFLTRFDRDRGPCRVDGRSPAAVDLGGGTWVSELAYDQVQVGGFLARFERLLITDERLEHAKSLRLPIFGYYVHFTAEEDISGRFGAVAAAGHLLRAWDFSLPKSATAPLFDGYARRFINAWVPRFGEQNAWERGRYDRLELPDEAHDPREPKTFEYIACDDKRPDADRYVGEEALVTIKGDVDDLGRIFERGLEKPSFAKMASLSRQLNAFFAVWLPWYCAEHFPSTYTVFAGGDDFFLIGPWRSTMKLAADMRARFAEFVAANEQLHFSAGLSMTKAGLPVRQMGHLAERALDAAKDCRDGQDRVRKNAVTCFGYTVTWDEYADLLRRAEEIERLRATQPLSTGYLYGLQFLADMAEDLKSARPNIESALWNSRFAYRTRRLLERSRTLKEEQRRELQAELGQLLGGAIKQYGGAFKVALFMHLYNHR